MNKVMPKIGVVERLNAIQRALSGLDVRAGGGVSLRPLLAADIDDRYLGWFADPTVVEFMEPREVTRDSAVADLQQGAETGGHFICAVCDRRSGTPIGTLRLGPIAWIHERSELSLVIGDRAFWAKGLGTEAIRLGSRLLLGGLGLHKLHGAIPVGHVGALTAYARAGWVIEARLKSHRLHNGMPMDSILMSCFTDTGT